MTNDQILILAILASAMVLFLSARLRHDVVALAALIACVVAGLVPADVAFSGFGHPAVITVACVLVLSRGLQVSGAVDILARTALPQEGGRLLTLTALMALGATLSGFMNNVGAMALLMPVCLQLARRLELAPGQVLMPLAFATILGGMTTLVGTPPNLIVAGFRASAGAGSFSMFDFTPVGLAVALGGIAFVALAGWRLVPVKKAAAGESFEIGGYLTEIRVPGDSKATGMTLHDLEGELEKAGAQVVGLVRNEVRVSAPRGGRRVRADDILVVEADVEAIADVLSKLDLKLEEQKKPEEDKVEREEKDGKQERKTGDKAKKSADDAKTRTAAETSGSKGRSKVSVRDDGADVEDDDEEAEEEETSRSGEGDEIVLRELVVRPESSIVGRSARDMALRSRYGINLLGVSRDGRRSTARLRTMRLQSGDLLLMQGASDALSEFAQEAGCVPLAERDLRIPDTRRALIATLIMAGAILVSALGLLPAAVAFAGGVLASMVLRTVPLRQVYTSIDWPVVVLLAALIPVAGAMEQTGTARLVADALVSTVAQGNAVVALTVVLVVTMFLSDVMNNAATAAVMCPIALGIAASLGASPDGFLMAVAIGASCAFLTPIGHQNNTLILGPGGFGFRDYWRLGLPLELVVVVIAVPLLLVVWPL
ncbi:MAG: SLC13 family permease [Stappia sp.]|nr:SLC13 family permease [Stappia sp.]